MLPSGWVTPARAPGVKSFQSKSGLVSDASARNFVQRVVTSPPSRSAFFSTCSEEKNASIPPEFGRHLHGHLLARLDLGSVSHLTFIPESDSNSGMFFSSTSMNGVLGQEQEQLLAGKTLPVEALRPGRRPHEGAAAAPAAIALQRTCDGRIGERPCVVSSRVIGSARRLAARSPERG